MTITSDVNGFLFRGGKTQHRPITVRISSDAIGETLSLASERDGIMLVVPYEQVEPLLEKARTDTIL